MKELSKKKEILEYIEQHVHSQDVEWSKDVIKKLKEFSAQGKMIRGSLFLHAYKLFGGEKEYTSVAAALELTQSGILAHDDVMDKDEFRRGKKTIHEQYKSLVTDTHYGYSMAICFGDIAFFESFKHLPPEVIPIFSEMMTLCAYGQMQDIHFTYSDREVSVEQILDVYTNKTATYTFSLPLMLAAGLTGKDVDTVKQLGIHLGIIFQIVDDYIGIFEELEKVGKEPGQDFKENKKTLYRYFLLQKDPSLQSYFSRSISAEELEFLREKVKTILQPVDEIINYHQEQVEHYIAKLDCDPTFFKELAAYNLSRKK